MFVPCYNHADVSFEVYLKASLSGVYVGYLFISLSEAD